MGPKGVSADRNGHIIVVDNKACCVFIFQPTGKLVTKFGARGNGDKQFAGTDARRSSLTVASQEQQLALTCCSSFGMNCVDLFSSSQVPTLLLSITTMKSS